MKDVDRSIFLGGLPLNTTEESIKNDLQKLGVEVERSSKIKKKHARRVVLKSSEQADKLIAVKFAIVNGKKVDVRKYWPFKLLNKRFA